MTRRLIIFLNIFLIGASIFVLSEEYLLAGEFEWVNQNDVVDGDELYLEVIGVIIIGMGIVSILTQIFYQKIFAHWSPSTVKALPLLLNIINSIYGFIAFFIGGIFTIMLIVNIGNNPSTELSVFAFAIIAFLCLAYLGALILKQVILD